MIVWSEDLRIGNPVIDRDHLRLIEIINEFHEGSKNHDEHTVMHETLKALLAYGRDHFAREEKIQNECMYPYTTMHHSEHQLLIRQIEGMAKTYFIRKTKPIDHESLSYINTFLHHWLVDHIKKFDTNMREWVTPAVEG